MHTTLVSISLEFVVRFVFFVFIFMNISVISLLFGRGCIKLHKCVYCKLFR